MLNISCHFIEALHKYICVLLCSVDSHPFTLLKWQQFLKWNGKNIIRQIEKTQTNTDSINTDFISGAQKQA